MRCLIILLVFFFPPDFLLAQDNGPKPFSHLVTGTSLTYIWYKNKLSQGDLGDYNYHELTWNLNISTNITKRAYLGLSGLRLSSSSPISGENKYVLVGVFGQYRLFPHTEDKFFVEVGSFYGDYCTCGNSDPYKQGDLLYWELGLGYAKRIWRGLSLDIGLNMYNIVNEVSGKYSYTQYVVGLEYLIGDGVN